MTYLTDDELSYLSGQIDITRRSLERMKMPTPSAKDFQNSDCRSLYSFNCTRFMSLAQLEFTVNLNRTQFIESLWTAIRMFEPYVIGLQQLRGTAFATLQDPAALADNDFVRCLCCAVAVLPSSQATEVCRRTDSGGFQGKRKADTREAHVSRCLRLFLLGNHGLLSEELQHVDTLPARGTTPDTEFAVPRKLWNSLLECAFLKDAPDTFRAFLIGASQWYERLLKKVPAESVSFRKAYGMPPLLALSAVAFRHRGYPKFELPEILQRKLLNLD